MRLWSQQTTSRVCLSAMFVIAGYGAAESCRAQSFDAVRRQPRRQTTSKIAKPVVEAKIGVARVSAAASSAVDDAPREVVASAGVTRISAPRQNSPSPTPVETAAHESEVSLPVDDVFEAAPQLATPPQPVAQPLDSTGTAVLAAEPRQSIPNLGNDSLSEKRSSVQATVESIDFVSQTAVLKLPKNAAAVAFSRANVVHRYTLGRLQTLGEFEVVASEPGIAVIRPLAGTSLRIIATGDTASVLINAPAPF